MAYANYTDLLRFPTSRSVGNCRNDAKRLKKAAASSAPLAHFLDLVAAQNGRPEGWACAMNSMLDESVTHSTRSQPGMTQDDLNDVLRRHKLVTSWGISMVREVESYGGDWDAAFAHERKTTHAMLRESQTALAFVNLLVPHRELNTGKLRTSYELKHVAERMIGHILDRGYVNHGAFIIAALHRGFLAQECVRNSSQLFFNIDENSPVLHWKGDPTSPVGRALAAQLKQTTGVAIPEP